MRIASRTKGDQTDQSSQRCMHAGMYAWPYRGRQTGHVEQLSTASSEDARAYLLLERSKAKSIS